MATLADIPVELLDKLFRREFIMWVRDLPINRLQKKQIFLLYKNFVGITYTSQDYHDAGIDFNG